MSEFLRKGDLIRPTDERIFTLPEKYRPLEIKLHMTVYPGTGLREPICRIMPNGEVFRFEGATLEHIAIILMESYGVNFAEMQEIWDLEDIWEGKEHVEKIGCPACAPVAEGLEPGPGCEQCEGGGWVYKVPNSLSPMQVRKQIAEIEGRDQPK
jgi:hypothetical protein